MLAFVDNQKKQKDLAEGSAFSALTDLGGAIAGGLNVFKKDDDDEKELDDVVKRRSNESEENDEMQFLRMY